MKHNLFLTMMAAVFLGSGVAEAAGTLYASQYEEGDVMLGSDWQSHNKLVVDVPLTLTGENGYLDLYNGATIEFQKEQAAEEICSIFTSKDRTMSTVYFNESGDVYNFAFDAGAQAVVAASAGKPITLIQDLDMESAGFAFWDTTPEQITLKLNGAGYGETVSMGGVEFTYVGPKDSDYAFKTGEIGFTGIYAGSHALNLVVGGSVPEPTTGSLSLLALAGLCARRRKK